MKIIQSIFFRTVLVLYFVLPVLSISVLLVRGATHGNAIFTAYNFTDIRWRNGIWIESDVAMFFVSATSPCGKKIRVGNYAVFNKSGKRKILNIDSSPQYINIKVEGKMLDPVEDGYPKEIKIIK